MKYRLSIIRPTVLVVLALIAFAAHAQQGNPAGKVTFLKGDAWVEDGLARRPLETGSTLYAGDRLRTGENANLYLRFLDQTFFALGPEAKMTINVFDERDEAEESFTASILRGAFRFVSGLLAREKPQSFKVQLTVGTIGIRGTNVAGEVIERQETDAGTIDSSARVVLLEDEEGEDTAIEVYNQFGRVVIDEPGFGTEIPDESSPPSPVRRMQIRTVNNLLRAIRNTTRGATQRRQLR